MSLPTPGPSASPSCSRTRLSGATSPGETTPTTTKSRKRRRKFEEWKSTQRKSKRNKGESYVSKTGKEVRLSMMTTGVF